ncbi:MAG: capsular biosynthesis protein [Candidatus Cloacimonetes bacterium]|nr:capsular biosynthesis protein [Candidatus Cloacimonadota bacterium]
MIDIHTHILPEIDDGSRNIEESLLQLELMSRAGVTDIVCTPHYISNYYNNNRDIIEPKLAKLQAEADAQNINIKLHKGIEILLDSKSVEKIKQEEFNINGSKYVLVESEMRAFPADFKEILYNLVKSGYKPILAHPERYFDIIRNPSLAEDFMHRNVYMQINAGSLLNHYGKESRKVAWKLIENGWAHFIASDNHCRFDEYILPTAIEQIRNEIDDYTANLLSKGNPSKMLNNEQINMFYVSEFSKEKNKSLFKKIREFIGK